MEAGDLYEVEEIKSKYEKLYCNGATGILARYQYSELTTGEDARRSIKTAWRTRV